VVIHDGNGQQAAQSVNRMKPLGRHFCFDFAAIEGRALHKHRGERTQRDRHEQGRQRESDETG
jgi:hypothetical protein